MRGAGVERAHLVMTLSLRQWVLDDVLPTATQFTVNNPRNCPDSRILPLNSLPEQTIFQEWNSHPNISA